MLAIASVGVLDSIYLSINVVFPSVHLVCPGGGIINCEGVTSSPYSELFHVIPVAFLGLSWFVLVVVLTFWRPSWYLYALVLFWTGAVVMVGYLVYVELGILGEICLYCTLAHCCTVLLGIPILKLAVREI